MARRHFGDNATSAAAYLPDLNFAVGRKGGRENKEERSVAAFKTSHLRQQVNRGLPIPMRAHKRTKLEQTARNQNRQLFELRA